jgi:CRISPR-associated protein Csm3
MSALKRKIFINGSITAETGLHIGGSNLSMAIGGADAVVVRNPVSQVPYIPGSSIKGKMRSLTERLYNKIARVSMGAVKNGPFQEDHKITRLYGMISRERGVDNIPSRIVVRDANMSEQSVAEISNAPGTDMPFTEVKTEVVIDRITSAAMPRQLERVPAGASFDFEIVLSIYEGDNEKELLDLCFIGLRLLKDDFLGGKGSRGSGQVSIKLLDDKIRSKDKECYETGAPAKLLTEYTFSL